MRVGLVLGAGGVMGGAWLTGGLQALAAETGWDPASADHIVGTSAGSMIAGLLACGVPPWFMVAHSAGESFEGLLDAQGRPAAEADRSAGAVFRLHRGAPPVGPGSWSLIARSLRAPHRHRPAALAAGWLPRGLISTEPLKDTIRRVVPGTWAEHPSLWIVACDYATGRRVPFGREDAPPAELPDAVAASCAIPGFYHPVKIGGCRYVDGGMCSMSNLDLVICLNPTSSAAELLGGTPAERVGAAIRSMSGKRLGHEARKLRAAGTEVLILQPTADDIATMGLNMMARGRRVEVMERARRTTALALRDLRGTDQLLPGRAPRARRTTRRAAAA